MGMRIRKYSGLDTLRIINRQYDSSTPEQFKYWISSFNVEWLESLSECFEAIDTGLLNILIPMMFNKLHDKRYYMDEYGLSYDELSVLAVRLNELDTNAQHVVLRLMENLSIQQYQYFAAPLREEIFQSQSNLQLMIEQMSTIMSYVAAQMMAREQHSRKTKILRELAAMVAEMEGRHVDSEMIQTVQSVWAQFVYVSMLDRNKKAVGLPRSAKQLFEQVREYRLVSLFVFGEGEMPSVEITADNLESLRGLDSSVVSRDKEETYALFGLYRVHTTRVPRIRKQGVLFSPQEDPLLVQVRLCQKFMLSVMGSMGWHAKYSRKHTILERISRQVLVSKDDQLETLLHEFITMSFQNRMASRGLAKSGRQVLKNLDKEEFAGLNSLFREGKDNSIRTLNDELRNGASFSALLKEQCYARYFLAEREKLGQGG